MLKKALLGSIVGLLVTTIAGFAVQVDGYCYLENQQNHAGTRVLFEADSPTAETDSAFTDSTGYYQADLLPGVYDIFYHHPGWGNESLVDQLISGATTLPDVNLWDVPDGVYISGEVTGVLEDTVYLVEGDLVIPPDQTLIIEPGARFYFLGDGTYRLWVRGFILAVGTETDSIYFMPAPGASGWDGIIIHTNQGICRLEYCYVTGATTHAIYTSNSYSNFELTISHCTVVENTPSYGGAIYCNSSDPVISDCNVSRNNGTGICLDDSSPTISNCNIRGNTESGIYCRHASVPHIEYCVINLNGENGIKFHNNYSFASFITQCTIAGNMQNGIYIDDARPEIVNTIVYGSHYSGIYFGNDTQETSVSYSNFYGNLGGDFTGNPPDFLGTIITTNPNGDSCDAYYNIYVDPEFVDPGAGNFYLQSTSLCIDAGDPTSPPDPGGSPADIGAFYYNPLGVDPDPTPVITPTEFSLSANYPNPFNPTTTLEFAVPIAARVNLVVYDVMGRKVATLVDGWRDVGTYRAVFDGSRLASGIYFVRMQAGDFHQVQKMVLLK